ncbi:MAG: 2-oxo acid dehydrogenase subunit E2 [Candidatus Obscuribacter sp.]|jgi:pyruvate/2-oxoglutarate dehydrogenase complex dihydrolipoamide acyltransferase (E2) component|nr:2-oxo acid dehydrogenase subunit E2 [Candidatus Obscuribacter sp.]MDQ5965667.1 2-oxo acid dehydrogenase subunit [Cyanobacteriota bacterium erpe_2018_sw_39hr_WHONDRS-SW48-000098_B_bin.30]MBK7836364.1 2-oxo acid dehydrogenase subunit E2 [Candidatus Obscuribacter sp.]MBK9205856.1 2-oxo acid dehydrogenase subunit E2 [Candidatus Obscuribacter sp.]MBK9617796.1 2-oxo acid dehydrogenase subunit E2 [Candidatus Obscuribacter sp.]
MEEEDKALSFTMGKLPRPRLNVLDIIHVYSKDAVPTYLFCDVDMGWAEEVRQKLKSYGQKVTITAFLLKAIGIAQRAHPESRTALLPWGRTVTFNNIVAGFTVERVIGKHPAVFFGAIANPDTKTVEEIANELRNYAEAKIETVPRLDEQHKFNKTPGWFRQFVLWAGMHFPKVRLKFMPATFGLSSLGKFGMTGLIPPCVTTSTIGVGEVEERAVVRDGRIEIRPMVTIILNFDHRLMDGAPAARFMSDVKKLLEGGMENYIQMANCASGEEMSLEKRPALLN